VSLLLPDRDNSSANSIKQYQYNTYAGDACFSDAIFVETAVFFLWGINIALSQHIIFLLGGKKHSPNINRKYNKNQKGIGGYLR